MHEESTVSIPRKRVFLDVDEAAVLLGTTPDVMRFLVAQRRIAHFKIGAKITFDRADLDALDRDALIGDLNTDVLRDWRVVAFERDTLTASEIARFFGVSVNHVRSLLNFGDAPSVPKSFLWELLVTGSDDRFATLFRAGARLEALAKRKGRHVPEAIRRAVRERDRGICRYCGQPQILIHLDHVISRDKGGTDDPHNLVVACVPCNQRKHKYLPHEAGMTLLPAGTRLDVPPPRRGPLRQPKASYATLVMRACRG